MEENILRYLSIHLDKNALELRAQQTQSKDAAQEDVAADPDSKKVEPDEEISVLKEEQDTPVVKPSSEEVAEEQVTTA